MLKSTAAAEIHEARERKGWSRAELEKKTEELGYKVTEASIYNIEKGNTPNPYRRTLYSLCAALELDFDSLQAPVPAEAKPA